MEIYKAHLHLADRIQHKQDNANKFYGGSITALIAALILISTSEDNDLPVKLIGIGVSILGTLLAAFWFNTINNYERILYRKLILLTDMEKNWTINSLPKRAGLLVRKKTKYT